jgi:hypothetical protein
MAAWLTIYGRPLAIPQGDEFMRWGSPRIVEVLFSDLHGLFSWTPIVALGVAGLVPLVRRHRLIGTAAAAAFVLSLYTNSVVADWWAGEAFGARRFVSCFPIFTLGLAAAFDRLEKAPPGVLAGIAAVFVGLNLLLLLQYQTFMHGLDEIAPYPDRLYGLWLARFVVPFSLIRHFVG